MIETWTFASQIVSARQQAKMAYAGFEIAQAMNTNVNLPVSRVFNELSVSEDQLLYSVVLIYPGDMLDFEIEFTIDAPKKVSQNR